MITLCELSMYLLFVIFVFGIAATGGFLISKGKQ